MLDERFLKMVLQAECSEAPGIAHPLHTASVCNFGCSYTMQKAEPEGLLLRENMPHNKGMH